MPKHHPQCTPGLLWDSAAPDTFVVASSTAAHVFCCRAPLLPEHFCTPAAGPPSAGQSFGASCQLRPVGPRRVTSSPGGRGDRSDPAWLGSAATEADALNGASSIVSRRRFSSAAAAAIAALAAGGESFAEGSDSPQSPQSPALIQRPRRSTYPDPMATVAAYLHEAAAADAITMPELSQQPQERMGSFDRSDSAAGGCSGPRLSSRCSDLQEVPPKSPMEISAVGSDVLSRPSSGEQSLPSLLGSEIVSQQHMCHDLEWAEQCDKIIEKVALR